MGVMAGNIIAAIPAVQLAVNTEIDTGLYVVMTALMLDCQKDAIHAMEEVATSEITTIF